MSADDATFPPIITLLRVGAVHTPAPSDATDILIANGRIAALGRDLDVPADWPVHVIERPQWSAVPAFIDQHVHVTGGGGEGGCGSRCPPITAEQISARGIATVVGVLGTDSISRSPADLLAATRALRAHGLNAWMYTGAYRVPAPTLTGDIQCDLAWVPEVIGVGEIAISDHRSSQPSAEELARLVSDARVGGMLAGKRGICHFHVGDGARGLQPLRQLLRETEIPAIQIIPTHVNRNAQLLKDAADYACTHAACIDVTAFDDIDRDDPLSAFNAIRTLLDHGVPVDRITISSDCNGSLPEFDASGAYAGMRIAGNGELIETWRRLVREQILPMEQALGLIGAHVARVLGLHDRKGHLATGRDADITLLDDNLQPRETFARGRPLNTDRPDTP